MTAWQCGGVRGAEDTVTLYDKDSDDETSWVITECVLVYHSE